MTNNVYLIKNSVIKHDFLSIINLYNQKRNVIALICYITSVNTISISLLRFILTLILLLYFNRSKNTK